MNANNSIFFLSVLLLTSCGSNTSSKQTSEGKKVPCIKSWESSFDFKDTFNVIDCNGNRQGRWLIKKFVVLNKKKGAELVLSEEGNYVNDKREGYWRNYTETGEIKDSVNYKNGFEIK